MSENPFAAPGNWFKGNLHMHTTQSDGEFTPQEAVDAYSEQGFTTRPDAVPPDLIED